MIITIKAIGCWGEGFHGWESTKRILQGKEPYKRETIKLPAPQSLPDNERRRSSQVIRLAVLCAEDACQNGGYNAKELPAIFASSNGDGFIVDRILTSLSTPEGMVSPSHFHNSVHNAPAGYWMIGHKSQQAAVSLALHDDTLAASLLKACSEAHCEDRPVLLCVYDAPFPAPLGNHRKTDYVFGCAMILEAGKGDGTTLSLSLQNSSIEDTGTFSLPEEIAPIACHNPAGKILPLLTAIARGEDTNLLFPYGSNHIMIALTNACA